MFQARKHVLMSVMFSRWRHSVMDEQDEIEAFLESLEGKRREKLLHMSFQQWQRQLLATNLARLDTDQSI